jgi:hypothetical protein
MELQRHEAVERKNEVECAVKNQKSGDAISQWDKQFAEQIAVEQTHSGQGSHGARARQGTGISLYRYSN